MVYTYKTLRDQVLRVIGEEGDTVTETMVKDAMNACHVNRVTQHAWPFMVWPKRESFTTTVGTHQYSLHQEMGTAISFYNTTQRLPLIEVPFRAGEEVILSPTEDEATAIRFQMRGVWPVHTQPSSATTIRVISDSGSDNTSTYNVVIKGETADGDITAEVLTPNGTNYVTSSTSFRTILAISKAAATNGTLTFSTSGGTELVKLYAQEMGRSYKVLEFLYEPSSADTISYTFYQKPLLLVNDYDVPQIPDQHALILVYDTLLTLAGALRTITSSQIQEWKEMQVRLERNLYREYGFDQTSLNAAPAYIKFTGDY